MLRSSRCIEVLEREIDLSADIDELRASTRFQRARRSLLQSNRLLTTGSKRISAILSSLKSFARLDVRAGLSGILSPGSVRSRAYRHQQHRLHVTQVGIVHGWQLVAPDHPEQQLGVFLALLGVRGESGRQLGAAGANACVT